MVHPTWAMSSPYICKLSTNTSTTRDILYFMKLPHAPTP